MRCLPPPPRPLPLPLLHPQCVLCRLVPVLLFEALVMCCADTGGCDHHQPALPLPLLYDDQPAGCSSD